MSIFQKSVLKSFKQDESKIAIRWAEFQKYLSKIDFIKTVKEEKYQDGFLKDIFENCLGYTLDSTNPNEFNLEREKKNETDAKKADGVIHVDNQIVGVIELKAQDTKNLDKIETQAFNYHASHSNSKYIIISNFDELRFYIDNKTAYEKFSLFSFEYEEYVTEYTKTKKLKFADEPQEKNFKQEWQSLFENDKILTCKLKEEITKTDKEIDEMVYKLYDLIEDEIKIVEDI
ncbi:MAG TPA: hypothetical protein VLZ29_10095 [Sulfurimonas sp.]|uniref:hypothetical protein n=1 Tax=Sulfurimonas sp. TaxID=2022749 RepID=UPI002C358C0B|nr:hypothetical protein [Sulfurimonas sp.]HUH43460.1 hypothetical protein [Sulfurimonas sp.]